MVRKPYRITVSLRKRAYKELKGDPFFEKAGGLSMGAMRLERSRHLFIKVCLHIDLEYSATRELVLILMEKLDFKEVRAPGRGNYSDCYYKQWIQDFDSSDIPKTEISSLKMIWKEKINAEIQEWMDIKNVEIKWE